MPARLMGRATARRDLERHIVVADPIAGPVNVRFFIGRDEPWRCRLCGQQATATCPHAFSAALELAESLLGLVRADAYEPQPKETE
jgi:hypothetical protein